MPVRSSLPSFVPGKPLLALRDFYHPAHNEQIYWGAGGAHWTKRRQKPKLGYQHPDHLGIWFWSQNCGQTGTKVTSLNIKWNSDQFIFWKIRIRTMDQKLEILSFWTHYLSNLNLNRGMTPDSWDPGNLVPIILL